MGELLQAIVITVGISVLISSYDGLFNIFLWLRKGFMGDLFECPVCLCVYVALIPTLLLGLGFIEYLTVIAASILITDRL